MDLLGEIEAKYEEFQNNCQKRKQSMEEIEQMWHHVFNHPKLSRDHVDKISKLKANVDLLSSDEIRISWIAIELLKKKISLPELRYHIEKSKKGGPNEKGIGDKREKELKKIMFQISKLSEKLKYFDMLPGEFEDKKDSMDVEIPKSDDNDWPELLEKVGVKYSLPSKKIALIFQHAKFPMLILTVDGILQNFVDKLNDEGKIQKSINILARLSLSDKFGEIENCIFDDENDRIYFTTAKISAGVFVVSLSQAFNGNDDNDVKAIAVDRCPIGDNRLYVGLAVDIENNAIFTSDPYRQKNVIRKSMKNEKESFKMVPKPPFKHQYQPMNLAFAQQLRLLAVCESYGYGSIYLYRVDNQGECEYTQRIVTLSFPEQISFPSRIFFDQLSNLIVTFIGDNKVKMYRNSDLLATDKLVLPIWSSLPLQFCPICVSIGPQNQVLFASNEIDEDEGTPIAFIKEFIIGTEA